MKMVVAKTLALLLIIVAAQSNASTSYQPGDLREAGAVSFPISCVPSVQSDFNRAVALLHSFFYEESRRIFTSIADRDPKCAMAQWGIAQTWWHPIWAPPLAEEFQAGTAAAEHALALESTPRERAFIEAIAAYYRTPNPPTVAPVGQSCHGPVGASAGVTAYASSMDALYARFPDDFEVRVFHAFAILAVGYANPSDLTLSKQKQAGELLEQLWKENPYHPGVAHYIIHSYDYPALAARALPAAKSYAAIAPWVPHALHMPSHIFTRLGMWSESIETNQASADASMAYAAQRGRRATETEELHALDYLMYSLLQQGRDDEAKAISRKASAVTETFPGIDFVGAYALAAIPARYALEREAWQEAADTPVPQRAQWSRFPFTQALLEYAHAQGRVHVGNIEGAREAIDRMRALNGSTADVKFDYFRKQLELQAQSVEAWIAHAEGRSGDAVRILATVADAEDELGKHPVSPGALMPAREQLGALLLVMNRPEQAFLEYTKELSIYPARLRSIYGAGLAAERAGDRNNARLYFSKVVEQTSHAKQSLREFRHASKFLAEKIAT